MIDIDRAHEELRLAGLDGWLLYDFKGLNPLALDAAGIPPARFLTRRWFCFLPQMGEPRWLVHAIERAQFAEVRGSVTTYAQRTELERRLRELLGGARRVAMEYSPGANVPAISRIDAGTLELVRAATGAEVASSGDLVQALLARWPATGLASHEEAWRAVERAVGRAWGAIEEALRAGRAPTEVELQRQIKADLTAAGLTWKGGPIVAADAHAADPHYETGDGPGHDAPIRAGSVVMLDVWAKKKDDPDAIYADVTFMGFVGEQPPEKVQRVWSAVAAARDAGLAKAQAMWKAGNPRAFEVDRAARAVVEAAGFGPYFTHRTGHSLGQEDHWIGANMDDFETHDERGLIAGTGFTIEPGIYLPGEFGMRSEIDVFVTKDGPVATTAIQRDLVKIRAR